MSGKKKSAHDPLMSVSRSISGKYLVSITLEMVHNRPQRPRGESKISKIVRKSLIYKD
jgi:hypothetical protein